ncbi:hypothetical protein [Lactobacillus johnsonii]|uniref:hypothetical protein n=1 Tax=Lactobacillus johnsonii TaxID=33959 RepID=UPI0030A12B30
MGRYNLKNDRRSKKYEHDELDVTRLSRELIRPKSANYGYRRESNHPDKVGVSLQFMSGHFLKTAEFTVEDIAEALDRGKCWLKQKNGGAINLRFVASYSPYKFYPKEDYRPEKQKR